jgi:hypothetical protein
VDRCDSALRRSTSASISAVLGCSALFCVSIWDAVGRNCDGVASGSADRLRDDYSTNGSSGNEVQSAQVHMFPGGTLAGCGETPSLGCILPSLNDRWSVRHACFADGRVSAAPEGKCTLPPPLDKDTAMRTSHRCP